MTPALHGGEKAKAGVLRSSRPQAHQNPSSRSALKHSARGFSLLQILISSLTQFGSIEHRGCASQKPGNDIETC
jgi:hypothetical protein